MAMCPLYRFVSESNLQATQETPMKIRGTFPVFYTIRPFIAGISLIKLSLRPEFTMHQFLDAYISLVHENM
jgi:hypothetical protein